MDEGSVCGTTSAAHLKAGTITDLFFLPEDCGLKKHDSQLLAADQDKKTAAVKMYRLLTGKGEQARLDAVILNSGLIFYVQNSVATIPEGVEKARDILLSGQALTALHRWIEVQNIDPAAGFAKLDDLQRAATLL